MASDLLTIGEVARRAGVSVQTLRHYDRLGLLVPSQLSAAGYRLYSPEDCARLDLLRALRAAHFDLETIAAVLEGKRSPAQAVALQLEVLELQARALRRQQVLLRAVLRGAADAVLPRLGRLQRLARLDTLEREAFLCGQLKRAMQGRAGDPAVWRAAVEDFPAELSEEQLDAWLELAELVTEAGFQRTLERQLRPLPGLSPEQQGAWGAALQALFSLGRTALREGRGPTAELAQAQLRTALEPLARLLGRVPDAAFARWLGGYLQSVSDPGMDRYWQLVARLKGWTFAPEYAQGMGWVLAALSQAAAT